MLRVIVPFLVAETAKDFTLVANVQEVAPEDSLKVRQCFSEGEMKDGHIDIHELQKTNDKNDPETEDTSAILDANYQFYARVWGASDGNEGESASYRYFTVRVGLVDLEFKMYTKIGTYAK